MQYAPTPSVGIHQTGEVPLIQMQDAVLLVFTLFASGAHSHTGRGGGGGGGGGRLPPSTVAITGIVPMPHSLLPLARRT